MPRYKATIQYDGTQFLGFQVQNEGRTVQEEFEKTLARINSNEHIEIFGAGRTDARVHALGQVVHFDMENSRPVEKLRFALDTQTPDDIRVTSLEEVADDFHSRFNPHIKTYEFRIDIARARSPFKRFYASHYSYPLDISRIERAIKDLEGTHDFTSFCASGTTVVDKVRTIYSADVVHDAANQELIFTFTGNGFLYKMIRIMVGTLLKIGNSRMEVDAIPGLLAKKNRDLAGPTAHPEGLYLKEIIYTEEN
ncbi:MAG: tRNA pseudouridine(38-40) synthase TruA [Lactobacillales bacterium]|jgi:tRNA pseudouridine38-40 synthase|nr:tRNA pseudouridine(38-40) synthase TruA [Lactobacillales bacterium]